MSTHWLEDFRDWADKILKSDPPRGFTKAPPGFVPVPGSKVALWHKRVGRKFVYWDERKNQMPNGGKDPQADAFKADTLAGAKAYLTENAGKNGLANMTGAEHAVHTGKLLDAHSAALPALKAHLKELAGADGEVLGRVKAVHSSVDKLRIRDQEAKDEGKATKYRTTHDLQDLTGVRVVYDTSAKVLELTTKIEKHYEIVNKKDYIAKPKDGTNYRSVHIIFKEDDLVKELQIRTVNQDHYAIWAHDLYKPQTRQQAAYLGHPKHGPRARAYGRMLSDALAVRDTSDPKHPIPYPPPGLLQLFPHVIQPPRDPAPVVGKFKRK